MKLLVLIGNAVVDIHLFISLERLITSSYCSLTSYDWPLAGWLSHFNRLGDLKQNSVPESSDDQTSTDSKGLCLPLKGMSGRAKRLQKFMLRQQVNMNTITTKLTADDHNFNTAPTSLLQANLFLSTFVCLVTKPNS